MTDALVGLGLSNLLLSGAVGAVAYGVDRRGQYPALAHLLWVLTIVAAMMPPLLVLSVPTPVATSAPLGVLSAGGSSTAVGGAATVGIRVWSLLADHLPTLLLGVWLTGSAVVFVASAQRIVRFGRLLRRSCRRAPPGVQRIAADAATELGLRRVPSVHISAARLAPMTWWSGGRVRVVLPTALRHEVDEAELRWILAHELAHIKRRDHVVRWLEWLASVAFWWNPVVWWARRNLRRDEEDACDALVLQHLEGQPRAYARTLLTVVEVMAAPATTAPTLATGIDAASSLEHRLSAIVSPSRPRTAPRAVVLASVSVALLLMNVGFDVGGQAATAADERELTDPLEAASMSLPTAAERETSAPASSPPTNPDAATVEPEPLADMLFVSADIGEGGSWVGTAGADSVVGTDADESFRGHAGEDVIGGGPGSDVIYGGGGADTIRGGDGADTIDGGRGGDVIGGGAGPDTIDGGAGADLIQGGAGRDVIHAGDGDDIVRVWADGTPDDVDCGSGEDRAVIDSTDTASRCETVVVRDPS